MYYKPSAKQDVRAVTAAGVDSAGAWEGSRNNKGGFSEQQPPLSGCSQGSSPAGASAGCLHGMSAKARALSPCTEGGGKTGGGGREGGKIAPYSTFIKEASSRPKNLMSYFSKKNSCCGTLRPSIFWPGLHVVDIG